MANDLVLLSGNANRPLVERMSRFLQIPVGDSLVSEFADGETRVELYCNVRGKDVFIVQSTSRPVNHHIMEAAIIADACRRASAARITLVIPYFGYSRQERKSAPRTPISAKLIADIFQVVGINRILAFELHNSAIQGFFTIPVDHLFVRPVFMEYFSNLADKTIIVSPDAGGVERARALAKQFGCEIAFIDKRREKPNESSVMHIVGAVEGKSCLIVDDIVDTAGSLVNATEALLEQGAISVEAAITHPVLSKNAAERIEQSRIKRLVVTDSIPLSPQAQLSKKIEQITIAELLSKAVRRIHDHDSVSSLFL